MTEDEMRALRVALPIAAIVGILLGWVTAGLCVVPS